MRFPFCVIDKKLTFATPRVLTCIAAVALLPATGAPPAAAPPEASTQPRAACWPGAAAALSASTTCSQTLLAAAAQRRLPPCPLPLPRCCGRPRRRWPALVQPPQQPPCGCGSAGRATSAPGTPLRSPSPPTPHWPPTTSLRTGASLVAKGLTARFTRPLVRSWRVRCAPCPPGLASARRVRAQVPSAKGKGWPRAALWGGRSPPRPAGLSRASTSSTPSARTGSTASGPPSTCCARPTARCCQRPRPWAARASLCRPSAAGCRVGAPLSLRAVSSACMCPVAASAQGELLTGSCGSLRLQTLSRRSRTTPAKSRL
jgi:hypothetical protein